MRDITLNDTFTFGFTTRSFTTGIPTTLAGTPVLSVKEGANDTFITAGVSVDIDTGASPVTGFHEATVVATSGNTYEVGKSYTLFVSTGTVGGVSVVGEVLENFTIQASAAAVDLANGVDGLGAIKADTAAILIDTTGLNGDAMRGTDAALLAVNLNTTAGAVDNVTLVATTTVNTDMRGTDGANTTTPPTVDAVADGVWDEARAGHTTAGTYGLNTGNAAMRGTDGVDTAAMRGTDSAFLAVNLNTTGGAVNNVTLVATTTTNTDMRGTDGVDTAAMRGTDSVDTAAMRGTDGAALATVATEARLAELDAANIPAGVDTTLTRLPATLVGGRMDANTSAFAGVTDGATRIARTTQGPVLGTVGVGSTATTIVISSLDPASGAIDQFKGRIVTFEQGTSTGTLKGQATDIIGNTAGGDLTVTALTTAPVSGDVFVVT